MTFALLDTVILNRLSEPRRAERPYRRAHQFTTTGPAETEIGFVLDGEGVGAGLFGRLFAAIYARNLDRAIPNLIQQIEREGG